MLIPDRREYTSIEMAQIKIWTSRNNLINHIFCQTESRGGLYKNLMDLDADSMEVLPKMAILRLSYISRQNKAHADKIL